MKIHKQPLAALFALVESTLLLTNSPAESGKVRTNVTSTATVAQVSNPPAPTNLPTQPLPIPGWLGFATVPADTEGHSTTPLGERKFYWSPSHREGQLVIFSEDWATVKSGTPLVALAPGFKGEITFLRSSQEPYGCDGIKTPMASFSATKPLPEGPVWVLPLGVATETQAMPILEQSLTKVPIALLPASQRGQDKAKAWTVGPATILLQKQEDYKVKLTLAMNNQIVYTQLVEKYSFGDDADQDPVDLSKPFEQGIPQPIGAFQLKAGQLPIIVLWRPGYEGNFFDLLIPQGNTAKRLEVEGTYYCAF